MCNSRLSSVICQFVLFISAVQSHLSIAAPDLHQDTEASLSRYRRAEGCPPNHTRCDNRECVRNWNLWTLYVECDGRKDCKDGSDESEAACEKVANSTGWAGSCWFDHNTPNGNYASICRAPFRGPCAYQPGLRVTEGWMIRLYCNRHYHVVPDDTAYMASRDYTLMPTKTFDFSICKNGAWQNPVSCVRMCAPLKSVSVDVKCSYGGWEVPCDQPARPNTTATARCKQYYTTDQFPLHTSIVCLDSGLWSHRLFSCTTTECGISSASGTLSRQGESPWLAALYTRDAKGKRWEKTCSGTLISPHIVLTAAHCLVTTKEGDERRWLPRPAKDIKVGLGKQFRNFYRFEENSVISDVKEIVIPYYYSYSSIPIYPYYTRLKPDNDIALLDLTKDVEVNTFIMPACMYWSSTVDSVEVNPGDLGQVAGWSSAVNDAIPSDVLRVTRLQNISKKICLKRLNGSYHEPPVPSPSYSYCFLNVYGERLSGEDGGGGLTVVKNNRHHVVGLLAYQPVADKSIFVFTVVNYFQRFLNDEKSRLEEVPSEAPYIE